MDFFFFSNRETRFFCLEPQETPEVPLAVCTKVMIVINMSLCLAFTWNSNLHTADGATFLTHYEVR